MNFPNHIPPNDLANNFGNYLMQKIDVINKSMDSLVQKFGFINGVDNVNWPPYRDSKS